MRCKWRGERCHLPTEGGSLEPVIPSSPSLYRYTEAEEKRETGEKKGVTHALHIPTYLQLHRCKYMRANTCTSHNYTLHTQTYTHHTGCRIQLGVVDKLVGLYPQSRRHQGKPITPCKPVLLSQWKRLGIQSSCTHPRTHECCVYLCIKLHGTMLLYM